MINERTPEEHIAFEAKINLQIKPFQDKIDILEKQISDSYDSATLSDDYINAPKDVRPATSSDIVVGKIIYHITHPSDECSVYPQGRCFWNVIDEVRYPDDDFKAYVSDDGCLYGLNRAYVKKIQ